jgi:hypothetical protein
MISAKRTRVLTAAGAAQAAREERAQRTSAENKVQDAILAATKKGKSQVRVEEIPERFEDHIRTTLIKAGYEVSATRSYDADTTEFYIDWEQEKKDE